MISENDEKAIKRIIKEVWEEIWPKAFETHIKLCPYGQKITKSTYIIIGGLIVIMLMTQSGLSAIEKIWSLIVK